jgi:HSP20 family molecular chaperone IbpA
MFEEVEPTIARVEQLYQTVTGKPVPADDGVYAPIPPEKDPQKYIEQQLEKLMGALDQQRAQLSGLEPRWVPAVAIFERADHMLICVDLPGVKREQVQVELMAGMLAITGQRSAMEDEEGRTLEPARHERPTGPFQRLIPCPAAPGAQVSAQLSNGVLEIRVARQRTPAETRRLVTVQ